MQIIGRTWHRHRQKRKSPQGSRYGYPRRHEIHQTSPRPALDYEPRQDFRRSCCYLDRSLELSLFFLASFMLGRAHRSVDSFQENVYQKKKVLVVFLEDEMHSLRLEIT